MQESGEGENAEIEEADRVDGVNAEAEEVVNAEAAEVDRGVFNSPSRDLNAHAEDAEQSIKFEKYKLVISDDSEEIVKARCHYTRADVEGIIYDLYHDAHVQVSIHLLLVS
uniref:Uncharacterized protein n=1 Tax=Populus alba TaxID=43335 RepID=A0A4U5Q4D6_POPAL|nr:hypothetical protein D5086_0000137040 [Populus alba]